MSNYVDNLHMSILPENIEKLRLFFVFILKYWNSDIISYASSKVMDKECENSVESFKYSPQELADDFRDMGPTFIKLGQMLSTRPDLLPKPYLVALAELQDNVEEIPYDEVEQIIEAELSIRISKAFEEFNKTPIASASIGQVHEAKLLSGKKVAVKIQRPGIRKTFLDDFKTLEKLAEFAISVSKEAQKYALTDIIEELKHTLLNELDYHKEARNLIVLKENLSRFEYISIPQPITDYSSAKVLTMEFVEGLKVTKVSPYRKMDADLTPLAKDLIESYLQQVIVDGFAHADPHPGNVFITQENVLVLMDLGMVARFSNTLQENILKLMINLSNYDGEKISEILLSMSTYDPNHIAIQDFKKKISRMVWESKNKTADEMHTGRLIIQMNQLAAQSGIELPVEINLLGKILLNMDQIVAILAPGLNIQRIINNYVEELMRKRMLAELKPENLFTLILETKKFAEHLPERLNKITDNIANNNLKVKVDAIDENLFATTFQKVANRITIGLIIASMIVGAALLIQVPTSFKIFGYPGLAIILFAIATLLGFYLIYTILFKDENKPRQN
ncbi:putative unusual protein kinase regulating ubiquinone biosynthesis (AarF/ABC1/UbiB family) [Balneicella halophila]|uniref:Putative unusual protein kinase regulating ubiquinone biosynthesis (AarF/ABC1/UbiB family) n=1 Tax=Balneicella halophila TaxID=1537566 RepID=A0A7L4UMN5_BALHA|nr:AarF/UbiB family protein [Balneicella halophila]PVX49399.1 putative unusual protein kinase regulating ubiquinone biosynthesis (AarF/ABC1/UbiB family) [Balneicella halophila]